jgi:hypothetical protein
MKKIVLEEVNRNREIMGLNPIMEQWEDNMLRTLGLDAEKILAKSEPELLPAEKNILKSIEKHAGMDVPSVLKSMEKNTLKKDFPEIFNKLEDEFFANADKDIQNAFKTSFFKQYPDLANLEKSLSEDNLKNLVAKYESSGNVASIEKYEKQFRDEIKNLPDGAIKSHFEGLIDNVFKGSSSKANLTAKEFASGYKKIANDFIRYANDLGEGGIEIVKKNLTKDWDTKKGELKDVIEQFAKLNYADESVKNALLDASSKMEQLDPNFVSRYLYGYLGKPYLTFVNSIKKAFGVKAPIWSGVIHFVIFGAVCKLINSKLKINDKGCYDYAKAGVMYAWEGIFGDGSEDKKEESKDNPAETGTGTQPTNSAKQPSTPAEFESEFKSWIIGKNKNYESGIKSIKFNNNLIELNYKDNIIKFSRNSDGTYTKQ